ncbi:MAG: hypothetical protein RI924_1064 [Bacteroidota bacterium]
MASHKENFKKMEELCVYIFIFAIRCGPGGEIGKRCGLRSRWSHILESSSLSLGTLSSFNSYCPGGEIGRRTILRGWRS